MIFKPFINNIRRDIISGPESPIIILNILHPFILFRVADELEPIPAVVRQEAGCVNDNMIIKHLES